MYIIASGLICQRHSPVWIDRRQPQFRRESFQILVKTHNCDEAQNCRSLYRQVLTDEWKNVIVGASCWVSPTCNDRHPPVCHDRYPPTLHDIHRHATTNTHWHVTRHPYTRHDRHPSTCHDRYTPTDVYGHDNAVMHSRHDRLTQW